MSPRLRYVWLTLLLLAACAAPATPVPPTATPPPTPTPTPVPPTPTATATPAPDPAEIEAALAALNADLPAGATLVLDGDALRLHADGDTLTLGRWQPEGRVWMLHIADAAFPLNALRVEDSRLVGEIGAGELVTLWEARSLEAAREAEARRAAFISYILERREELGYQPFITEEALANRDDYVEVMTVEGTNPETGHTTTFTLRYNPQTVDPRGIPGIILYDEAGQDITGQLAADQLAEIDAYFKQHYAREGFNAVDGERLVNEHLTQEQTAAVIEQIQAEVNLADVDEVNVWLHGIPYADGIQVSEDGTLTGFGNRMSHTLRTIRLVNKDGETFGLTSYTNATGRHDVPNFITPILSVQEDSSEKQIIVLDAFVFCATQETIRRRDDDNYYLEQATRLPFTLRTFAVTKVDAIFARAFEPDSPTSERFTIPPFENTADREDGERGLDGTRSTRQGIRTLSAGLREGRFKIEHP